MTCHGIGVGQFKNGPLNQWPVNESQREILSECRGRGHQGRNDCGLGGVFRNNRPDAVATADGVSRASSWQFRRSPGLGVLRRAIWQTWVGMEHVTLVVMPKVEIPKASDAALQETVRRLTRNFAAAVLRMPPLGEQASPRMYWCGRPASSTAAPLWPHRCPLR